MAKTRWYQERSREAYYRQAKKEGYRARSAYKLLQVQEKFGLLKKGQAVADLGCAPGGWSQVLVEMLGPGGVVVGLDLQRVRPIPGVRFLQGDITNPGTHERLAALLAETGRAQLDAVVSDIAPDMSGNYELDQFRSVHLATMALEFATRHLRTGGNLLCKVFEGADFQPFREEVRKRFRSLAQYHPPASRKSSSEVYLVAKGFRGRPGEPVASSGSAEPAPQNPAAKAGEGGPDEARPAPKRFRSPAALAD